MSSSENCDVNYPNVGTCCSNSQTILWTIDSFSSYSGKDTGLELWSPPFSMGKESKSKWRLKLYPCGLVNHDKYVSFFMHLVSSEKSKVTVDIKFFILNKNKKKVDMKEASNDFSEGSDWGYKSFVLRNTIMNENTLPDDILTVGCEITLLSDISWDSQQSSVSKCNLADDLDQEMEMQRFTDFTFYVAGKKFHSHKFILAARSSVFSVMFEHNKQDSVEIEEMGQKEFQTFLRFIYTGRVGETEELSKNILAAADKYSLEILKTMCEESLSSTLSIENAADLLLVADTYGADILKGKAMDFIIKHNRDVMETDGWKSVISKSELVNDVFRKMSSRLTNLSL